MRSKHIYLFLLILYFCCKTLLIDNLFCFQQVIYKTIFTSEKDISVEKDINVINAKSLTRQIIYNHYSIYYFIYGNY